MARKAKVKAKSLDELCDEIEALLEGVGGLTVACLGEDSAVTEMDIRILDLLDKIRDRKWIE